ncbi:MAG: AI-2E family transporter [Acidobacteria bacterium]|nr:AI-2E family transporter [Acidobacteriota bacterium]MBV9479028.1 AI-2E family transporter [Acidobacteriota bacterium]
MAEIVDSTGASLEDRPQWRLTGVIFFGILALLLLYAAYLIIAPFMTAVLLGAILVTLTFHLFARVRTRMHGNSTRAAIVMLLLMTVIIVIPAVILGILLVGQANVVVEKLQSGEAQQMIGRIDLTRSLGWIRRIAPNFDPATLSPQRMLLPAVQQIPGWVARHGGTVLGGIAGMVLGFALVLLSMFFFYVEGESIVEQLSVLSPLPKQYDREFAARFKDVIDATFRGQLFTALAQGIATGIGLAIARVPGAAFWAAVAALLSLVPMVGAAAVWVPAAIYLSIAASMGGRPWWQAIFLIVWGVLVVSTVDNIVRPWAMKGKAQLPAIPLLFAVLGGMQAFGFVGLVIGPLVFSLLMSIIEIYKQSFRLPASGTTIA